MEQGITGLVVVAEVLGTLVVEEMEALEAAEAEVTLPEQTVLRAPEEPA